MRGLEVSHQSVKTFSVSFFLFFVGFLHQVLVYFREGGDYLFLTSLFKDKLFMWLVDFLHDVGAESLNIVMMQQWFW